MTDLPLQFRGFGPDAFAFLESLAANNSREWFLPRKADYDRDLKGPMMDLVADLSTAFAARGVPLSGDPRTALFRVNRDVRFSRDKSPYKTVVSAVLTRDGTKGRRARGLFYVQVGLDRALAALGFHGLEPDDLSTFRTRIARGRGEWRKVEASLAKAGLALSRDDAAARLPRPFHAEEVGDLADALKLKSYTVSRPLTRDDVADPALVGRLAAFAAEGRPLLDFGWDALGGTGTDASDRLTPS